MENSPMHVDRTERLLFDQRGISYVIKQTEWKRIKKVTGRIPVSTNAFANAGWACLGIGISLFVTAITLPMSSQSLDHWVLPAFWIAGVASSVITAIAFLMDRRYQLVVQASREDVLTLLDDIEAGFETVSPPTTVSQDKVALSSEPIPTRIAPSEKRPATDGLDENIKRSFFGSSVERKE